MDMGGWPGYELRDHVMLYILYSLWKIIIAPSGHTFVLLIFNIDLNPFLWGTGDLMVITETA